MTTLQGVDAVRRAAAIALDVVTSAKKAWQREHKRPAALYGAALRGFCRAVAKALGGTA